MTGENCVAATNELEEEDINEMRTRGEGQSSKAEGTKVARYTKWTRPITQWSPIQSQASPAEGSYLAGNVNRPQSV